MSDQCKNCTLRENMKSCRQTPCNIRESWFAIEIEKAAQDEIDRLDAQKMELEGQVAMLRVRAATYCDHDEDCALYTSANKCDCGLIDELNATAQTAEEYRKRVQAEAKIGLLREMIEDLRGTDCSYYPMDLQAIINVIEEDELRNQQAEGKGEK